jgi:hypothetical protein
MLIVELSGGLGNQLFQYAAGCGIADKLGTEVKFNLCFCGGTPRVYELPVFNIEPRIATLEEIKKTKALPENYLLKQLYKIWRRILPYKYRHYVNERGRFFDRNMFRLSPDCYLEGYWQSEKYFEHIEAKLKSRLVFRKKINNPLAEKIKNTNSVSIHFRRTDFRNNICDLDYYQKAVCFITSHAPPPVLFVFSDDLPWVRKNFQIDLECVYVEGDSAADDLQLISLCRHNIIANSTFSWWGAWLNNSPDKIVVVPAKIYENNRDIVPNSWHVL